MEKMPGGSSTLYDRLGVSKGADGGEIRKAYMKLARTHHPDKGGDADEFKKIQQAYEVLSDDGRRAVYDATGQEDGVAGGPGGGHGGGPGGMPFPFPFDLGAMFGAMGGGVFGMGGGGGGPGGRRGPGPRRGPKGPPKVSEIPLSLHDFFHGKAMKIKIERDRFCGNCKGSGAERWDTCVGCGGAGMKQRIVMMGPGMQGMMTGPCEVCGGEGKKIGKACDPCAGKRVKSESNVLDVRIEPGMRPGETIVFSRECSDSAEYDEPGDLHIRLVEANDTSDLWRVEGTNHLRSRVQVGLEEALLGCVKGLEGHPGHPQGLPMEIPAGVQSGETITFSGEGMPIKGGGRGDLQVVVTVVASEAEKAALKGEAARAAIRQIFQAAGAASQIS